MNILVRTLCLFGGCDHSLRSFSLYKLFPAGSELSSLFGVVQRRFHHGVSAVESFGQLLLFIVIRRRTIQIVLAIVLDLVELTGWTGEVLDLLHRPISLSVVHMNGW